MIFMRNKHLHIFRRILFVSLCLCSIMIEAQNPQNVRPNNKQVQMEMNAHLSIIDSVANVCYQEVMAIRNDIDTLKIGWEALFNDVANMQTEMDTLSCNACNYINDKETEINWNMWGVILAIGSILVMIIIYIKTYYNTKNQIIAQHKDTIKQIEEKRKLNQNQIDSQRQNTNQQIEAQRDLTQLQISEIRSQSEARLNSLEEMCGKIECFTGQIQDSVEHFERTIIGKDDNRFIEKLLNEMTTENENLYQMLSEDFVNLEDTSRADKAKYAQGVSKIRNNVNKIQNTMEIYISASQIPDAKPYLESLLRIANGPVFDEMDEQLGFYELGKTFFEELTVKATAIFNQNNLTNDQES